MMRESLIINSEETLLPCIEKIIQMNGTSFTFSLILLCCCDHATQQNFLMRMSENERILIIILKLAATKNNQCEIN
jgi:hypothetical protein